MLSLPVNRPRRRVRFLECIRAGGADLGVWATRCKQFLAVRLVGDFRRRLRNGECPSTLASPRNRNKKSHAGPSPREI